MCGRQLGFYRLFRARHGCRCSHWLWPKTYINLLNRFYLYVLVFMLLVVFVILIISNISFLFYLIFCNFGGPTKRRVTQTTRLDEHTIATMIKAITALNLQETVIISLIIFSSQPERHMVNSFWNNGSRTINLLLALTTRQVYCVYYLHGIYHNAIIDHMYHFFISKGCTFGFY